MRITTYNELGKAVRNNGKQLEISGKIVSQVRNIRKPSDIVWKSLGSGLLALLVCSKGLPLVFMAGVGTPFILAIGGGCAGVVLSVLGYNGTTAAIKIGKAGGGIKVLNDLRSYKETSHDDSSNKLILSK